MTAPPSLPSLLAVFAHPDDEALLAGGVLAQHAAAGARTTVVTATWSPDSHRAAELADSLRILGAGEPRMLGYADARIPESAPGRARLLDAPLDEAVELVVRHLREARPDVIVISPSVRAMKFRHKFVLQRIDRLGARMPRAGLPPFRQATPRMRWTSRPASRVTRAVAV